MKFAPIIAVVCATSMFVIVPAASAFAQDPHQHAETAPPEAASPRAQPPMMQMMQKMHSGAMPRIAMMGGSFMAPGGTIRNIEGHIAFLNELKITDAQQKPWDQFADALRTNARELSVISSEMMSGAAKQTPPVARLEQQERMLTLQLDALNRSRAALEGLNAVLSDDQKKQLDELI
jgi:hypothetical protein